MDQQQAINTLAALNKNDQRIQAALECLSTIQLDIYLHEVEWIIKLLERVPSKEDKALKPDMYQRHKDTEEQVFALYDALIVERARRGVVNLQAEILDRTKQSEDLVKEVVGSLYSMVERNDSTE
jgi:hypothetical protein